MPSAGRIRYVESVPPPSVRARGTLVLLHAFPLNSAMWAGQMSLASGGWHVVAPDFLGMGAGGESDPPASSVDDYAGQVVDLLDALHVDDAVVGGLSIGGYVAFALFRLAPNYIRALVLADTRAEADTPEGVERRKQMLKLLDERGREAVVEDMLPKLLSATTLGVDGDIVAGVRRIALDNSRQGVAGMITALMTRPDATPLLSTIHRPTLIVVGGDDVATPPEASETMLRAISGSEMVTIAGAGHLSNIENPQAFNAALERFLERRV